jgi:hypothetical protein
MVIAFPPESLIAFSGILKSASKKAASSRKNPSLAKVLAAVLANEK